VRSAVVSLMAAGSCTATVQQASAPRRDGRSACGVVPPTRCLGGNRFLQTLDAGGFPPVACGN